MGVSKLATNALSQKALLVQGAQLFSGISLPDCAVIVASARERIFSRRQTIFAEGDPVHHISLLTSGCVKLMQFGLDGSEVILANAAMSEDDEARPLAFGELGLYTHDRAGKVALARNEVADWYYERTH